MSLDCRLSTDVVGPMFKIVGSEFKLLPGNIVYVAVNELEDDSGVKTILAHLSQVQAAKGLIHDLRHNGGGNSQNGVSILQMLASSPFQWESERTPDYRAVYRAWGVSQRSAAFPRPLFPPDQQHHIALPVIVLTSAETFSAAKDFVALFESMHRGLIVGEPTAGSTGQPFSFKLPGGGSARICTKDTRLPDGSVYMGGWNSASDTRETIPFMHPKRQRCSFRKSGGIADGRPCFSLKSGVDVRREKYQL
jgi:carboxyl-terminal processing protease